MLNLEQKILSKINEMPSLWCFCIKDMLEFANYKTISKCLERMADKGLIKRITWGIYVLANGKISEKKLLDSVALAIARNNDWTIIPSGLTALDMLGITKLEGPSYVYVSNGPYRKYQISDKIVEFKRTTMSAFSGSKKNIVIFQALKAIGDANITEQVIHQIKKTLSSSEIKSLSKDIVYTPIWMHKHINKICLKEEV